MNKFVQYFSNGGNFDASQFADMFGGKDGPFNNTTNNYCELYAILMALSYCSVNYSNDNIFEINSDSAYCVNMLKENGWIYSWAKNGWTRGKKREPIENLELIKQIWNYMQELNVKFVKVKGHSGNKDWNDYVDKLAVKAKMEE